MQTRVGRVSHFLSHSRHLLTLRSAADQSVYKSLILFRLAPDAAADVDTDDAQIYVMEAACPHLGADMSHAEIEDLGDADHPSLVAVCPWHRYDFDLKTGHSETGLRACVFTVELRPGDTADDPDVWIDSPEPTQHGWEVVERRPVSEEFAVSSSASAAPADPSSPRSVEPVVPESDPPRTLIDWAVLILNTPNPTLKVERTRHAVHLFRTGKLKNIGQHTKNPAVPPDIPPREAAVQMVDPQKTGRRGKAGSLKSRVAMLHALANIEQWAIDLAWDIIARYGPSHPYLPPAFYSDFTKVALDESKHFSLLSARLEQLGSYYGALSVHAGLWDSARETKDSLLARLAIIHLVHEARGLDVNPVTIAKFTNAGDAESARVLNIIHCDEVTHVTAGHRWFTWLCARGGEGPAADASPPPPLDAVATFRRAVQNHFAGTLKGPFNVPDRARAGLSPEFYENLTGYWGAQPPVAVPSDNAGTESENNLSAGIAALTFQGEKERVLELVEGEARARTAIAYDS